MMAVSLFNGKLWFPKAIRLFQQIRNGYIVLLPESNLEHLNQNPLFKSGLPDIENITIENCSSVFGKYILDFEHCIRETEKKVVEKAKVSGINIFEDIIDRFEESGAQFESTWGLLKTLYIVDNNLIPQDKYIPLHERARDTRSLKFRSHPIYNVLKSCDQTKLTEEEQRVISKFRLEGKLSGIELGADGSELFKQISVKLSKERSDFGKKYKISSSKFSHIITDAMITRDFPQELLKNMVLRHRNEYEGPWHINLTHANKFLRFCPDRRLRWNTWLAQRQVSSSASGTELNNSQTLEAIRKLRRDMANVLGYISYAHMSIETKMADSLYDVQQTLNLLLGKAKQLQTSEIQDLQEFAEERGFRGRLELWDIPFWDRRQKLELFNWDERKLREYFSYEKVITGLMEICSEMFSLRFEIAKAKTWHKDVKLFHIYDHESTRPLAGFYIDPYSREGKTETPGQVVCIRPSARALGPSIPLVAIIFSFDPPSSDAPTLLDFDEVENIFKKFGQALQQLMSTVNYSEVSGLSFIEWDAVEVVSNVMRLWLNNPEILQKVSGHYKTNEPFPVTNLEDVRRHLSGLYLSEEIYRANLDLQLHSSTEFWSKVMKRIWPDHFIFDLDPKDFHPCNFVQPFAGEFGAAYFSHIWAKMLAEDVYAPFRVERDIKAVGLRFRDTYLSFGGGCNPSEVFRRFLGRDPSPEALLGSIGKRHES